MRPAVLLFALSLAPSLPAQQPDAATIMARVAANQDRSEAERVHYTYVQHARTASRRGNTVHCEEITETRVTPSETGSAQQLLKLDGHVLVKGKSIPYDRLAQKHAENGEDLNVSIGDDKNPMDRDLVEHMRDNFTNGKSKDGIGAGLFPLTTKTQAVYSFHLLGREKLNGREVFHLTFEPNDRTELLWKGDAFIDTTAFEPVMVRTTMSRKIPFAVRTLLGTSLPGLGFTVIYAPQPATSDNIQKDAVWFPTSFGTEFDLRVFFFFARQISLSAQNHDFERTHVNSRIVPAP